VSISAEECEITSTIFYIVELKVLFPQRFDTVGLMTGRASGLQKILPAYFSEITPGSFTQPTVSEH